MILVHVSTGVVEAWCWVVLLMYEHLTVQIMPWHRIGLNSGH